MNRIARIQRRKISGEIVDEIKRLISEGVFSPDDKLPSETELCNQFGVGRSSVREALSMLAAAEIIETRQGEGTFVRKIQIGNYIHPLALSIVTEKQQTLHLLEMRRYVESGIVELAAIRRDQNDIKEIRKTLLDLEMKLQLGESEMEADFNFHMAVASASKNPLLIQTIENLAQVMKQSIEYAYKEKNLERRWQSLQEHKDIFSHIENQDSLGAVSALKRHLENISKLFS
ncbi:FadR/GntR family transcriptional regulator [Aneurinibacillus sp. Ricciae_BoGa-3]|uniref:FadR/GntR family transcriptional regulator n=1 Tax=Aneurinibacillus sp. Ricciae_BoGa-3 TaxID=3022697 RepID=UPI00234071E9|nr:FadR/GntR family transcriptional regulator [Aneurinibacillus sp. Ricciae_BoGa-3]WCK56443.1 FadR/GntR family transcriptional regulator [Aneurinibacillus sp. Ricciae_BoGa-3]